MPFPQMFLATLGIERPLIGFYDTPDASPFIPLAPKPKHCFFSNYANWMQGEYTHMTGENFKCPGSGYWLLNKPSWEPDKLLNFLVEGEGLKVSCELMGQWLKHRQGYGPKHEQIIVGPLLAGQEKYLKSITMFVNPDQLSALMIGTQYYATPDDPEPVLCRFGSGCSQLVALFDDLEKPQAIISMNDTAMRKHLPPDTLGLTVTRPMFDRLCTLDENSFLGKPFWNQLSEARKKAADPFSAK